MDIYNKLPLSTITASGPLEVSSRKDPVSTVEFLDEKELHLVPFGQEEAGESEGGTGDEVLEQEDENFTSGPVPEPEPIPSRTRGAPDTNISSYGPDESEPEKITDYLFPIQPHHDNLHRKLHHRVQCDHLIHHRRALLEACEKCGS